VAEETTNGNDTRQFYQNRYRNNMVHIIKISYNEMRVEVYNILY
jgi:hypothetical protein